MSSTLSNRADGGFAAASRRSLQDWKEAFRLWRLWTTLGWEDLSDRYRRTFLGVSWLLTSFALFILVYIVVFHEMSGVSGREYALYITIGWGLWGFINSVVSDSCLGYITSSNWMLGVAIPYPVFFLQAAFRNWVVFLLTLVVVVAIMLWLKSGWTSAMLWAIPGLLSYLITPLWLAAILAPLCARYRDLLHAIRTAMQLMFFATPILWLPGQRDSLVGIIARYNFLTYFVDVVRFPLIHDGFPAKSWLVVIAVNAIGLVLGFLTYTLTRKKVAYWL
jgi:ABC-type polysaccharide/polyol phosphate export permease